MGPCYGPDSCTGSRKKRLPLHFYHQSPGRALKWCLNASKCSLHAPQISEIVFIHPLIELIHQMQLLTLQNPTELHLCLPINSTAFAIQPLHSNFPSVNMLCMSFFKKHLHVAAYFIVISEPMVYPHFILSLHPWMLLVSSLRILQS